MSLQQLLNLTDKYIAVLQQENHYIQKMMLTESKPIMERKIQIATEYNQLVDSMKNNELSRLSNQDMAILQHKSKILKKLLGDNNSLITFAVKLTEQMISSVVDKLGGKGKNNKGYNHMGLINNRYKNNPKPITLSKTL